MRERLGVTIPEVDGRDLPRLLGFAIAFVVLTAGVPLIYLTQPLHFDEAIWLVIADRMADGSVLYGDVYDHKPPAIFYLTFAVEQFVTTFEQQLGFLAYGDSATPYGLTVYVLRLLTYGVVAITGMVVYVLGKRIDDSTTGMIASLVFVSSMYLPHFVGFYFLTEPWAILTTVVAAILLLDTRSRSDVLAGAALGVGVMFNQTVFLFGLAFVVFRALQFRYHRGGVRSFVMESMRRFGTIGAGFLLPVSAVLLFFYSRGLLTELLYFTVYVPLITYSPPFSIHGRILAFLSIIPIWILSVGMIVWVTTRVAYGHELATLISGSGYRDGGGPTSPEGLLFVSLWAVFISYPGLTGFDAQHQLLFVFAPIAVLAAIGARRILDLLVGSGSGSNARSESRSNTIAWSPTITGVVVVGLLLTVFVAAGFNGVYASNVLGQSMDDQVEQSHEVDEKVEGVAYTWVPQQNHLYYFGEGIEPAPTYFMTVYSQPVSDRVIEDIERAETEYLVVSETQVDDEGYIVAERSKWFAEEKAELVEYLNEHYRPEDETDEYVIFELEDAY